MTVAASTTLQVAEQWDTWQYFDQWGENWDAQPACIITDYILAIQAFTLLAFMFRQKQVAADSERLNVWYAMFFATLGLSGLIGGILHTYVYEIFMALRDWDASEPIQQIELFGLDVEWTRYDVDVLVASIWRVVLVAFLCNSFTVVGLSASRYYSAAHARVIIFLMGCIYSMLAVWAVIYMLPITFLFGYLPVLFFGAPNVFFIGYSKIKNQRDRTIWRQEVTIYAALLSCCASQILRVSISDMYFNHNAVGHVLCSVAAWFMYKQCVLVNRPMKE